MTHQPRLFSFFMILLLGLFTPKPIRAATLTVNTLADNESDGCALNDCTLREALADANDGDEIIFSVTGTIIMQEGVIAIRDNITIEGPGADQLSIQGDTLSPIFSLFYDTLSVNISGLTFTQANNGAIMGNGANLTLTDLTFSNNTSAYDSSGVTGTGTITLTNVIFSNNSATGKGGGLYNEGETTLSNVTFIGNSAGGNGGGMYNSGITTLTEVTFTDNTSSSGSGGGIYCAAASTLENVTFDNNSAHGRGGGLHSDGTASLANVTFTENNAGTDGGGFYSGATSILENVTFSANTADRSGGGMLADASSTIAKTTFANNIATVNGGGLQAAYGITTVTNTTFSGNRSFNEGGGLYKEYATCTLSNVTFSNNRASNSGGSLYSYFVSGSVTLNNVIIANTISGGACGGSDVQAVSTNNLIEDSINACGLTDGTNGNIIGNDPLLGVLADNGGATQTHALLPGSPAIDAGDNNTCPPMDQNGTPRPLDGDGDGQAVCDIGAYESLVRFYLPLVVC